MLCCYSCAEGCFTGADDDYPVIEHATNPVIPTNIEYDDNTGRIKSVGKWSVTIRNGITAIRRKKHTQYDSYSWDHYVFAFHYPAEDYRLVLPSTHVEVEDVIHNFCIKTENTNCPDQM